MNVQLTSDVAWLLEQAAARSEYSTDEVVDRTLRVWFGLMELCCSDPLADALFVQLVARAAALDATDMGDSS